MEEVSELLGHQSIKVTQEHYAQWNKARQRRAEENIRAAWANDPHLAGVTKAQKKSQNRSGAIN